MQSTFTQYGQRSPDSTLQLQQRQCNELHQQQEQHQIFAQLAGAQSKINTSSEIILGVPHQHYRDLFSGSLGIPDVSTHVGSVVHAFETLAQKPKAGEKPCETTSSSTKSLKTKKSKKLGSKKQHHAMTMDHDYRKSLFASSIDSSRGVGGITQINEQIFQENLNLNRAAAIQHFGHLNSFDNNSNNNKFENNLNNTNSRPDEDEFTRGSTVSQSFIKNVTKYKTPLKRERNLSSTGRFPKNRNGDLEERYHEYGAYDKISKKIIYKPRTLDRADL